MKQFSRQSPQTNWQNLFFIGLFSCLLLIMAGLLLSANWQIGKKRSDLASQLDFLKRETEAAKGKQSDLQAGVAQINKEDYLEKEARERMNLKKPGEEVVVVVPTKESPRTSQEPPKSLWERLLEKIGF